MPARATVCTRSRDFFKGTLQGDGSRGCGKLEVLESACRISGAASTACVVGGCGLGKTRIAGERLQRSEKSPKGPRSYQKSNVFGDAGPPCHAKVSCSCALT